MNEIQEYVRGVKERYGSIEAAIEGEGLYVVERDDMPERLDDIFRPPVIFIRAGLNPARRRFILAHCLGHHFLHHKGHVELQNDHGAWRKHEDREADEFGAWAVIPESVLSVVLIFTIPGWIGIAGCSARYTTSRFAIIT